MYNKIKRREHVDKGQILGVHLILITALLLRLLNLDKPEGLWNDEYVSWFVASKPFFDGFWSEVLKQCHMPLYYLYLKPFTSCPDVILRLLSVIPGILAIPVMFHCGKFFSDKCAKISALITATLPFLIYYSQEVRFYSLLFFFTTLSLYYLLKIINKNKGYLGFAISCLLILFTHILGGIYVFAVSCYLICQKKQFIKWALAVTILFLIGSIPIFKYVATMINHSQWWGNFSYTNILFLFSDFFSPILTNKINAYPTFFYRKDLIFNFFLLIPTILAGIALFIGAKKEKFLFLISTFVILFMSILATNNIIVFITKYAIEILPVFILLISIGFSKNKTMQVLCTIFILLNVFTIFTPFYPTKEPRIEGHKIVGDVLSQKNPDKVLYTYYDENRFLKYLPQKIESKHISKINRFEYLENSGRILDFVEKGETVSVVFLESVSFIPPNLLEESSQRNLPEMFITFSKIKHNLITKLEKDYTDFEIEQKGSWLIITAKKFK